MSQRPAPRSRVVVALAGGSQNTLTLNHRQAPESARGRRRALTSCSVAFEPVLLDDEQLHAGSRRGRHATIANALRPTWSAIGFFADDVDGPARATSAAWARVAGRSGVASTTASAIAAGQQPVERCEPGVRRVASTAAASAAGWVSQTPTHSARPAPCWRSAAKWFDAMAPRTPTSAKRNLRSELGKGAAGSGSGNEGGGHRGRPAILGRGAGAE